MALIVQKFGGTSVANIERIKAAALIVLKEQLAGNRVVVVVSAMAGVTNILSSKCSEVSDLNAYEHMQEYDAVVSSGEILTSGLLALELQRLGLKSRSLQGWQIPIITNDNFANARVDSINTDLLCKLIAEDIIPVITGFQGVTDDGQITTLGKGGSDTTAALISAALKADRADIYTDVIGVFTADPRIVNNVFKINTIGAKQMLSICMNGAKVLHPRAALAVLRYKFDMRILSSFEDNTGTLITSENIDHRLSNMEEKKITAITSNKNLLQIELIISPNSFSSVIKSFSAQGLNIDRLEFDYINKVTIIISIADKNKFEATIQNLKMEGKILGHKIDSNISTVTLVGYGIKSDNGFCFKLIDLLNQDQIKTKKIDVTETEFTAILDDQDTEKAVKILHSMCYSFLPKDEDNQ